MKQTFVHRNMTWLVFAAWQAARHSALVIGQSMQQRRFMDDLGPGGPPRDRRQEAEDWLAPMARSRSDSPSPVSPTVIQRQSLSCRTAPSAPTGRLDVRQPAKHASGPAGFVQALNAGQAVEHRQDRGVSFHRRPDGGAGIAARPCHASARPGWTTRRPCLWWPP